MQALLYSPYASYYYYTSTYLPYNSVRRLLSTPSVDSSRFSLLLVSPDFLTGSRAIYKWLFIFGCTEDPPINKETTYRAKLQISIKVLCSFFCYISMYVLKLSSNTGIEIPFVEQFRVNLINIEFVLFEELILIHLHN